MRLVYALWRFWQQRGYLDEGRRNIDRLSGRIDRLTPESRARFAEAAGGVAYWQADFAVAVRWYDAALAIRRELADPDDPQSQRELANALYNRGYTRVAQIMGVAAEDRIRIPTAQPMMEEALAIYRTQGDTAGEAACCGVSVGIYLFTGRDGCRGGALPVDSIALHRDSGQRTMEAWSLHMLSVTHVMQDRIPEAAEPARQAIPELQRGGDLSEITLALDVLAVVAVAAANGCEAVAFGGRRASCSGPAAPPWPSGTRASSRTCPSASGRPSMSPPWSRCPRRERPCRWKRPSHTPWARRVLQRRLVPTPDRLKVARESARQR